MRARTVILYALSAFASFETLLAVVGAFAAPTLTSNLGLAMGLHQPVNPIFGYSIPLSVTGWIAVGLVVFQGRISGNHSRVKSAFAKMGFGPDVYDLMITMRGGGSRITLLENMATPKNRLELSELTGIDWREVDREISILEKYGLVKIYAQTGTVKMYQVTEQGKLLMNLVGELNGK
jgi:hypothetical protein